MAFKNSLKILFGKGFFPPSRAAASLLARLPKPAHQAFHSAARLALARPSPVPCQPGLPPRAGPSSARRAVRRATLPTASGDARRVAATCRGRPDTTGRWQTLEGRTRLPSHSPLLSISFLRASEPPRAKPPSPLLCRAVHPRRRALLALASPQRQCSPL